MQGRAREKKNERAATERAQQKRAPKRGRRGRVCLQGFVVMRRLNDRCCSNNNKTTNAKCALTHTDRHTHTCTWQCVFVFALGFGDETPYRRCDVKGVCCNHQRRVDVDVFVVVSFAVCSARQKQFLKRRYEQRNDKLNTLFSIRICFHLPMKTLHN